MSLPFACSSAQPRDGIEMPNWTMPEPFQPFVCCLKKPCPESGQGTGMFGTFLQVVFVGREGFCCSILFT